MPKNEPCYYCRGRFDYPANYNPEDSAGEVKWSVHQTPAVILKVFRGSSLKEGWSRSDRKKVLKSVHMKCREKYKTGTTSMDVCDECLRFYYPELAKRLLQNK